MNIKYRSILTNQHKYVLTNKSFTLIQGQVTSNRNGYGFLKVAGTTKDLYLAMDQMKKCIQGDIILAKKIRHPYQRRYEARVIRIIKPNNNKIIGRYFINKTIGFVVPGDLRLNFDIVIPQKHNMNTQMGSIVIVKLIHRPKKNIPAIGKIVKILGHQMNSDLATIMALSINEIPTTWSAATREQILSFSNKVLNREKKNRNDLRKLPFVTIDGDDAKDFDDAIYCQKKSQGGWYLWVAVADVSHYVLPNSPLDLEAKIRGTSIYFPLKVVPMLPEILSNNLCSLNPKVDRLCIVCEMDISVQGKMIGYKHYQAVITSHARLTYNQVGNFFKNYKSALPNKSLIQNLQALYNLSKTLEQERKNRGGICVNTAEPKFIFNSNLQINNIKYIIPNDAYKLVEECMILANTAAADFVKKNNKPMLFRDHEPPTNTNITNFCDFINDIGFKLPKKYPSYPIDYTKLMPIINSRPNSDMLKIILVRSMKQACYAPKNRGHFGLALNSYAHFTSPIRRYPDLILHRIIKYLLSINHTKITSNVTFSGYYYKLSLILKLGQHCSITERRAEDATRDVLDWLKCNFMQKYIGNIFTGIISGITKIGIFVRIQNLFIDGLVPVSELGTYYTFDFVKQRLISVVTKKTYCVGDTIKIILKDVNIDEKKKIILDCLLRMKSILIITIYK